MIQFQSVKEAAYDIIPDNVRRAVLISLSELIRQNYQAIIIENKKDLEKMAVNDPKYDRLELNHERIIAIAADVISVANLPFSINEELSEKILPNKLCLKRVRVPLGVVAAIYESRPNVTIDIFSLCFKSGNACILKGGKEAHYSNLALYNLILEALELHGLNPNLIYLMDSSRESVYELLNATNFVDVCIPRGSQQLIDFVRQNAKIPVIETGAGIVHTYFDVSGNLAIGQQIINNAKTRRVSVCNALDTLIIHKSRLVNLFELVKPLLANNVQIFADEDSYQELVEKYNNSLLFMATKANFGLEFLSYKMSIKTVDNIDEALMHIRKYSSKHSEAIIADDKSAIDYFLQMVDAAAVYANASTAFTDGGEFGLGAEVGISTQKLHARGPMGLDALTSYKWQIYGDGQIR